MKYLLKLTEFYKQISHFGHQLEVGDVNRSFTNLQKIESITLPFFNTPINLYHAFKLLTKFLTLNNDTDDFLIIIYDSDKRLIVESLLINIGVDPTFIKDVVSDPIPEDFNVEGEDSTVFQTVNKFIQKKYAIQIGRIKIIDIHFIEKIVQDNQQSNSIFSLLLEGCDRNLIRSYPQMPILSALKRITSIFPDYLSIFNQLQRNLKSQSIPFTFFDEDWYITFLQEKNQSKPNLTIAKPFEFGRITIHDHSRWIYFMKEFRFAYKKRYKASPSYFIDINWLVDYISDVSESEFPLSKIRFEFLLQRLLYFVKKNEELWDVTPRPIIYNGFVRLFRRLFGYHVNPAKLSFWSIPSNLTQFFKENFGPKDLIVVLFAEKNEYSNGMQIQLYQGNVKQIKLLNLNVLEIPTLCTQEQLYTHLVDQLGFFKNLIRLDLSLVQKLFHYMVVKRSSKNPLAFISFLFLLRKLDNSKNFGCYPETPWFKFFKRNGAVKFYRKLNRILSDFLEF